MGACTSSSDDVMINPSIRDTTLKRSKNLPEGNIDKLGSNSSQTGTGIVAIDSYDNEKERIQVYEVKNRCIF